MITSLGGYYAQADDSSGDKQEIVTEPLTLSTETPGAELSEDVSAVSSEEAATFNVEQDSVVSEADTLVLVPQELSKTMSDGVTIKVSGNLPQGVELSAEIVNLSLDNVEVLYAYDITLWLDGKEYAITEAVSVSFINVYLPEAKDIEAYHIDGEKVEQISVATADEAGVATMTADSFSVYAVVTRTFTVSYDKNGGSGTVQVDSTGYLFGATATVLSGSLTRAGAKFIGWSAKQYSLLTSTAEDGVFYAAGDTFTVGKNTTLYAVWFNTSCSYYDSRDKFQWDYESASATAGVASVTLAGGTIVGRNSGSVTTAQAVASGSVIVTAAEGYMISSYRIVCGDKRSCQTVTTSGIVTVPNTNRLVVPVTEQNFAHMSCRDPYYILVCVMADTTRYSVTYDLGTAGAIDVTGTAPADSNRYSRNATVTVKAYTDGSSVIVPAGYLFDGWLLEGTTTRYAAGATFPITQNSNLVAQWKLASYTLTTSHDTNTTILPSCGYNYENAGLNVTFNVSPGYSVDKITIDGNDISKTDLNAAVAAGYVTVLKTGSHAVGITSVANNYHITYYWEGAPYGETPPVDFVDYHVNDTVPVDDTYYSGRVVTIGHDHYAFSGWDTRELVGGKMPASDVIITGSWEMTSDASYTLTYDANGGSGAPGFVTGYSRDSVTLTGDSSSVTKLPDAVYEYTFAGWSTAINDADTLVTQVTFSEADIVVHALWNRTPRTYTLTVKHVVGSTNIIPVTILHPTYNAPYVTYALSSSQLASAGYGGLKLSSTPTNASGNITADITVTYVYIPKEAVSLTINYLLKNGDGAKVRESEVIPFDDKGGPYDARPYILSTIDGYIYDSDDAATDEANNKIYSGTITDNVVINVYYEIIRCHVSYEFRGSLIPEGAELPDNGGYFDYGYEFNPEMPSVRGYSFDGWYFEEDESFYPPKDVPTLVKLFNYCVSLFQTEGKFEKGTPLTENIILYGYWSEDEGYDVTYKWIGSTPSDAVLPGTASYFEGDSVTIAKHPTTSQSYWTFNGWKIENSAASSFRMGTKDVTIVGSWSYNPPIIIVSPSPSESPEASPSLNPSPSISPAPSSSPAPSVVPEVTSPVTKVNSDTPQTGDNSGLGLMTLLAALSAAGLGAIAIISRRKKRSR